MGRGSDPGRDGHAGVRRGGRLALSLVLVVAAAAGCGIVGPDDDRREEIEERREEWESRSFRDYAFTLRVACFCLPAAREPVRVEVRRGRIARIVDPDTGELVDHDRRPLYPTIEGLFTILLEAVEADAHEIDVDWDAMLGHPRHIFIDYERRTVDEEIGYEVRDVVPLD